ncbi:MAG: ribbon-helix-helix domain-containing protein [Pseudomonadota bacterium]
MDSRIEKHSVLINGHATSFTLENWFWRELKALAQRRGQSLSILVGEIDENRGEAGNLSAEIRVFVAKELAKTEGRL